MSKLHYSYWIRPGAGDAARQPMLLDERNEPWLRNHGWHAVSYKEYVAFRKTRTQPLCHQAASA